MHIPMGQLNQRQDELADDRQNVTVCRSGSRSGAVAEALDRAGYRAENLEGGMQAWARDRLSFFVAENDLELRVGLFTSAVAGRVAGAIPGPSPQRRKGRPASDLQKKHGNYLSWSSITTPTGSWGAPKVTLDGFFDELGDARSGQTRAVSMDMGPAFGSR